MTTTYETNKANRRGGFVHWPIAEIRTIGPIVRARPVTRDGFGQWETVAVSLNPIAYVREVSNRDDVGAS